MFKTMVDEVCLRYSSSVSSFDEVKGYVWCDILLKSCDIWQKMKIKQDVINCHHDVTIVTFWHQHMKFVYYAFATSFMLIL